jgi:Ca-activated chloride channel homolog
MAMLVKASNPQNEYFVINFNDDTYLDQDFTRDSERVIGALRRADARGGTALNDALMASADHLRKSAHYKKKVLILIGDGADNESHASTASMLNDFKKPDAPVVFAIGLFRSGQEQRGRKVFETLANETGGAIFLADNPQKLNEVVEKVVKQIRSSDQLRHR